MSKLDEVLLEVDGLTLPGDLFYWHSKGLEAFSRRSDFLETLAKAMGVVVANKNAKRFNFLVYLIQAFCDDSSRQRELYSLMMDFINTNIDMGQTATPETELNVSLVLDVFWHQPEGLKDLNQSDQLRLCETLKRAATFRYVCSEQGDEPFFAINKSMDLIKHQSEYGNSEELEALYLNHFDEMVRKRASERIGF